MGILHAWHLLVEDGMDRACRSTLPTLYLQPPRKDSHDRLLSLNRTSARASLRLTLFNPSLGTPTPPRP